MRPGPADTERSLKEFAAYLESLRRELVQFLARLLTQDDAEDAAAQLICEMFKRAKHDKHLRLKPAEELRRYVFGAAKNIAWKLVRDAHRRSEREEAFRSLAPPAEPALPDATVAAVDLLARLPRKLREAYELVAIKGHSLDEAARQLGIRVGTLKSRLRKARLLLARENAQREIFRNRKCPPRG